MVIDSAIKVFVEKYDETAMESIDALSKEYGLNIHHHKMKLFNIQEAFDMFQEYIKGYATYKVENANNEKASSQEAICERTTLFIESGLFGEKEFEYKDLPGFVESYANGVKALLATVDEAKRIMMESEEDIDQDHVGALNEFTDAFMTEIDHRFYEAMDSILWASGYNSDKALTEKKDPRPKKEQHVFL